MTRKQPFRDLVGAAGDEMVVGLLMCGYRREGAPALRPPRKLRPLTETGTIVAEEEGQKWEEEEGDTPASRGEALMRRAAQAATPVLCFRP